MHSTALVLTADMMFLPQLSGAGKVHSIDVQLAMNAAALLEKAAANAGSLVILDLSTPGLDSRDLVPKLRALEQPPRAILAYGPHVHEARLAAAAEAGCDEVFTRGQFNAQMSAILQRYARASAT